MVSKITTVNELKLNSADILCGRGDWAAAEVARGEECALCRRL